MKRVLLSLVNLVAVASFGYLSLGLYLAFVLITWGATRLLIRVSRENKQLILAIYALLTMSLWFVGLTGLISTEPLVVVGSSFYILVGWRYIYDLSKTSELPITNIWRLMSSLGFFVTILCGPIYRLNHLDEQFEGPWQISTDSLSCGVLLITFGFAKKTMADFLRYGMHSSQLNFMNVLVDLLIFYFDLSGYSDIAIGTGEMMNLQLPSNFAAPLLALSPRQFWRRWHISLGEWIRHCIFLPWVLNAPQWVRRNSHAPPFYSGVGIILSLTFLGLWHRLSWSFAIWGFANGLVILFCVWRDDDELHILRRTMHCLVTLYVLSLCNVFRLTENPLEGLRAIANLHRFEGLQGLSWGFYGYAIFMALLASFLERWLQTQQYRVRNSIVWTTLVFCFLFVALCHLRPIQPFIYMSY
jgi:D-alanyl-lipoteichoic acid acyltransferase DltB (MBOAT superfamily)